MAFNKPALRTIIDGIIAEINTRLQGVDARLPGSNLNAQAFAFGAAVHGLYGYIEWALKQANPLTAEDRYLEDWAELWLDLGRLPAVPAEGSVTATGAEGSVVAQGTLLQRADGTQYQTTESVEIGETGSADITAVAVQPGQASNAAAGMILSWASPVAGVAAQASVSSTGMTGGADSELDEALRGRIKQRLRALPFGGRVEDYIAWALEVPGTTRAWLRRETDGDSIHLTLYFVRDGDESIVPDAAEVEAMQAYIDARRPTKGFFTAAAPTLVPINFNISSLQPATQDVRSAITAELRDLIFRQAAPGGTVLTSTQAAEGGTILLSHMRAAISAAIGEEDHVLTSPTANDVRGEGELAVMGTITWS